MTNEEKGSEAVLGMDVPICKGRETPDPTTGESDFEIAQGMIKPPTTGEWTAKTVLELWQKGGAGCDTNSRMCDIAIAHNAELAAERENHEWLRRFIDLNSSPDANKKQLVDALEQLREQLAAEREHVARLQNALADANAWNKKAIENTKQLRDQLAVAVKALNFYAQDGGYGSTHERARDALAKIGEGK